VKRVKPRPSPVRLSKVDSKSLLRVLERIARDLNEVAEIRRILNPSLGRDDGLPPDWESRMTSAFNGSEKGEVWRVNAKPQVAKTRFSRPSSANYQGDLT